MRGCGLFDLSRGFPRWLQSCVLKAKLEVSRGKAILGLQNNMCKVRVMKILEPFRELFMAVL